MNTIYDDALADDDYPHLNPSFGQFSVDRDGGSGTGADVCPYTDAGSDVDAGARSDLVLAPILALALTLVAVPASRPATAQAAMMTAR